jgi:hypothetical protein
MVNFGTRAHGASKRREIRALGMSAHKGEWMESGDDPLLSPTVFLVEQPANSTVASHFHRQNQFQLFVDGAGNIGPKALQPVTIHYAGAYTGYGPLVAGPAGLKYFTIRPVCESGAIPLDEAREKMVRGPKRHATSAPIAPATLAELERLDATTSFDAIPLAEDGMGARVLAAPPQAQLATEFPRAARGTFVVVLAGSVVHGDGESTRWESIFVSSEDEMPMLTAGRDGAQLVFLFTPAKAPEYM